MNVTTSAQGTWLRSYHPTPEGRPRLVCFPHAGGSASFFFAFAKALAPSVEVLAVQYPGRQDRRHEPCVDDLARLADEIAEIMPGWADRPPAFFGHSMGATLAFEVALRLGERPDAVGPSRLFVSGRRAPGRHRTETVHLRDDAGLIDELLLLNGTEPGVLLDDDVLRMVLPSLRADYRAIERHVVRPGARVDCPITVLVGDADPKVTVDEARAWREHTTVGSTDVSLFPGGHFYLNEHRQAVVDLITAALLASDASI